jgi:Rps23 Pro-64 3,4-dihydroxylase Tpa1-like proline 4-hydroxylase
MKTDKQINEEKSQNLQQRIADFYTIDKQTWSSVDDLGHGIFVYHDVIKPEMNVINRLEEVLSDESNNYEYKEALVGYAMKIPEYRDCLDFKFKKTDIQHDTSEASIKLQNLWQDAYDAQLQAVKHYSKTFNIGEIRYWEAINFVKYGPGHHFQEHHDNGYSYNCVVSLVAYPNDDYEGGELAFRLQNINVKPKAGDLFIFPSNFMYPHRAMPVHSGTKYSMVTMLDYSDKYHSQEFYKETGT